MRGLYANKHMQAFFQLLAFALEIRGLFRGNRGLFPRKLLHIGNRIFSDFFRVGSGVPIFRSDPCAAVALSSSRDRKNRKSRFIRCRFNVFAADDFPLNGKLSLFSRN